MTTRRHPVSEIDCLVDGWCAHRRVRKRRPTKRDDTYLPVRRACRTTELAFSTNAYTEYALPEAIRRIADYGYDGLTTLERYTYPDEPDRTAERVYEELEQYARSESRTWGTDAVREELTQYS